MLPAPRPSTSGGQARLAAAQVAALQRRFAANPTSLQLVATGQTAGHLSSPASSGKHAGSAAEAASRSLAAMLRVAAAEAPAILFSTLHLSPATAAAKLAAGGTEMSASDSAAGGGGGGGLQDLAEAPDVHGRALMSGMWMAPRLVARPHLGPGFAGAEVTTAEPSTGIGATEGSVIVTGDHALLFLSMGGPSYTECKIELVASTLHFQRMRGAVAGIRRRYGRCGFSCGTVAGRQLCGDGRRPAWPLGTLPCGLAPCKLQVRYPA